MCLLFNVRPRSSSVSVCAFLCPRGGRERERSLFTMSEQNKYMYIYKLDNGRLRVCVFLLARVFLYLPEDTENVIGSGSLVIS